MDTCPTIKVKLLDNDELDHVVINEEDFDEASHKKLSAAELKKLDKAAAADGEADEPEAEAAAEPGADDGA